MATPEREYEWTAGDRSSVEDELSTPKPGTITACLVVRNEAATIERCLRSLEGIVDEIVVVHDGPCGDGTLDIAARFGCRAFVESPYGHCERHLPFAYRQARSEWLLTIDADEFLSDELRAGLRALTAAPDVAGYEFLWPLWDGRRYTTTHGPFKRALVRRAALRMVGIIHSKGEVDGAVRRVPLRLEHRPPYNNFSLGTIATKWRARARLQAREYLTDLNTVPRFNYPGRLAWTKRREWTNRWAAALVAPAGLHTFLYVLRQLRGEASAWQRVRFAITQALYRSMVTAYVAIERTRVTSTSSAPLRSRGDSTAPRG